MRSSSPPTVGFGAAGAARTAACRPPPRDGPGGPRAALERTFGETATSIDSAKLDAALKLNPEGLLKLGGPIAFKVKGPFAAPTASSPSRFDLALLATLGGRRFEGGALSTGTHSYLRLDDRTYSLGASSHPPANA